MNGFLLCFCEEKVLAFGALEVSSKTRQNCSILVESQNFAIKYSLLKIVCNFINNPYPVY